MRLLEADANPVTPTTPDDSSNWVQPAFTYIARRPSSTVQNAGTATAKNGSELRLAVDVSALLEVRDGDAVTIVSAGCGVTDADGNAGADVGTLALNEAETAVGGLFTNLVVGEWTVTWVVVLSDGTTHEIPGGLVVTE